MLSEPFKLICNPVKFESLSGNRDSDESKYVLCRDYNCDSTTTRLQSDYDVSRAPASIRRNSTRAKMNMSIFRRSRVAVESNANCNFDHFRRSRMRRGIVVSKSYRSRIAIVI